MASSDGFIREFLIECQDGLDQLDRDLLTLEKEPGNTDVLGRVFRTLHTIKGTSGFFGFSRLGAVAHAGESLLSRLRDGQLTVNASITGALLTLVDALRTRLASIDRTGKEGIAEDGPLIVRLEQLLDATPAVNSVPPAASAPSISPTATDSEPAATEEQAGFLSEASIRVRVELLDKLMNLVGELVLARNEMLQLATHDCDPALLGSMQRVSAVTTQLQESVVKTRMQPIGNLWKPLPRVVRNLAAECGKQVELVLDGQQTELDRSILQAIKDPLTHLVRNAIDHGIERPEQRLQAGKPALGRLCLHAFHESGQVHLELSDDGGGIDVARVRRKAIECGLIATDHALRLSEPELLQLIFLPGFSTADTITSVSGRGVGMDVVKNNIERIGGTIELLTRSGEGTTVKIRIPLTLAIIPAIMVTSGGERYAIPQINLVELLRVAVDGAPGIEWVHETPVLRARGGLLPIVDLQRELGTGDALAAAGKNPLTIAVVTAGSHCFGLIVDEVRDTEEIVVKPLSKRLKSLPIYAGATIMGDGRVALILDVLGLGRQAGVLSDDQRRDLAAAPPASATQAAALHTLVLAAMGSGARLAIPLSHVARLEEIPGAAVEHAAGREVVQYRGQIMPLMRLSPSAAILPAAPMGVTGSLQVIVHALTAGFVGLVVEHILDIVETPAVEHWGCPRPGYLGSVVIQGRVTDVLDVPALARLASVELVGPPQRS